jgi:hypothetical protein
MSNFLIQINIPIFHHSIIPSGLQETCSIKNAVIAISCTISETLDAGITKAQLLKAMEGHILAQGQSMGRYKR